MKNVIALLTDFGLDNRFVADMYGVALSVDDQIRLFDITHLVPPGDIHEGSRLLAETLPYWPVGTIFICVVDPGVGTSRAPLCTFTNTDHFIIAPDNGLLTHVFHTVGLKSIRQIDEKKHRLPGSEQFHTFHGRDLFAYTGARLASGKISFSDTGYERESPPELLELTKPAITEDNFIHGNVISIERPFGNLVTDIPGEWVESAAANQKISEFILEFPGSTLRQSLRVPFVKSFGFTEPGGVLIYIDSAGKLGIAMNSKNLAEAWSVPPPPFGIALFPANQKRLV